MCNVKGILNAFFNTAFIEQLHLDFKIKLPDAISTYQKIPTNAFALWNMVTARLVFSDIWLANNLISPIKRVEKLQLTAIT